MYSFGAYYTTWLALKFFSSIFSSAKMMSEPKKNNRVAGNNNMFNGIPPLLPPENSLIWSQRVLKAVHSFCKIWLFRRCPSSRFRWQLRFCRENASRPRWSFRLLRLRYPLPSAIRLCPRRWPLHCRLPQLPLWTPGSGRNPSRVSRDCRISRRAVRRSVPDYEIIRRMILYCIMFSKIEVWFEKKEKNRKSIEKLRSFSLLLVKAIFFFRRKQVDKKGQGCVVCFIGFSPFWRMISCLAAPCYSPGQIRISNEERRWQELLREWHKWPVISVNLIKYKIEEQDVSLFCTAIKVYALSQKG